jgi:DNA (cytosine-5)-methyltransferase 1
MNVLDLFSGIGGFSLGLERAGFRTVAFCEIEPYARRVLAKHWPEVPCYDDVRTLTADRLKADGISVDVICGGFPCQDISVAGKQAGIRAETRSGLWSEIARLTSELRPRFVIVENVSNLLSGPSEQPGGWFGTILGDLAALGYDAEWHCIPASAVGAPHRRDRIWIIAHATGSEQQGYRRSELHEQKRRDTESRRQNIRQENGETSSDFPRSNDKTMADTTRQYDGKCHAATVPGQESELRSCSFPFYVADADSFDGGARRTRGPDSSSARECESEWKIPNASCQLSYRIWAISQQARLAEPANGGWWISEPDVGRVANGVPCRVDRLRCLGNAVVPQIPEIIGRAIMESVR